MSALSGHPLASNDAPSKLALRSTNERSAFNIYINNSGKEKRGALVTKAVNAPLTCNGPKGCHITGEPGFILSLEELET